MFKDEVDFEFIINLLLPHIKEDKLHSFNGAIEQVNLLAEGEIYKWTKEDKISELFFQLS